MSDTLKWRVLVVDDHPMFRHGIVSIVNAEPELEVCAEASNFTEALAASRAGQPELALIDISMPGTDGIELIKTLRTEQPKLRMLALSMFAESLYALRAVRAGALGYSQKDVSYETLLDAIRCVRDGRLYLSAELLDKLLAFALRDLESDSHPDLGSLSHREIEVLTLYGQGLGTREIGERVRLGMKTIETYRNRIRQKLGLADLPELLRFAGNWVRRI